jgi:hypothetical protein
VATLLSPSLICALSAGSPDSLQRRATCRNNLALHDHARPGPLRRQEHARAIEQEAGDERMAGQLGSQIDRTG